MTNKITNWRTWVRGVVGAVIGGAANAVTLMVVKPEDFNFAAGFGNLGHFALISGIVSAALYLKQHPVPEDDNANGPGAGGAALLILCGLLALAPFGLTGCATLDASGPYHGDKALYVADTTLVSAYTILDRFVTFEYEHRAALAGQPAIRKAADEIRLNAPRWFADVGIARDAYAAHPVAANLTALNNSVHVIQAAIQAASGYLIANPQSK